MDEDKPKVTADMKPIGSDNLFAVGSVTIDGLFTINDVRVKNIAMPDGRKDLVVLLPRKRYSDGHWEPVFTVSSQLKKEIDTVVMQDIAERLGRILDTDSIQVSVKVYTDKDLLGYASLSYKDLLTINNIRIVKADNEDGIRLDFPYSYENGKSNSLIKVDDTFARSSITHLVSEAYQEILLHPDQELEKKEAAL